MLFTGVVVALASLSGGGDLNVTYDSKSLLIGGERLLWLSGGIHYARHTPELWAPALQQMKAAGFSGVTSYTMWNIHEQRRGELDWGQVQPRANLTRFLATAEKEGLFVHLRLGPYIDAEWDYGGFPWWINEVNSPSTHGSPSPPAAPGTPASPANAAFRAEMQRWITAVVDEIRPFLASRGGPVVMLQIENEFSDHSTAGLDYIHWAIDMAEAQNTGIPWTFCNNSGSVPLASRPGLIFTANAGMGPETMITAKLCGPDSAHPDQPCLWSEIEESFYQWSSGDDGGQPASVLADQVARWFSLGGSGSNYYMWAGGTDYGTTAGDDDTTSYHQYSGLEPVFNLPNEPKYAFLSKLHHLLADRAALLLGDAPATRTTAGTVEITTFANATHELTFVANLGGTTVSWGGFTLLASSHVLIVEGDAVAFNSSDCAGNTDPRFEVAAATAGPLQWSTWGEGPPSQYHMVASETSVPTETPASGPPVLWSGSPIEQVALELRTVGGRATDYAWYSTNFTIGTRAGSGAAAGAIAVNPCQATLVAHQRWVLTPVVDQRGGAVFQIQLDAGAPGTRRCIGVDTDAYDGGFGATLHPCNKSDGSQFFSSPASDGRFHGARGLCLDIQDGSTAAGANVFVYDCGPRPAGNQLWAVQPASSDGAVHIVSKMDGYCLTVAPPPTAFELEATLHESTIAHVFLDGAYQGTLDNQGHNGADAATKLQLPASLAPGAHTLELLSAGLGISADEASATVALGGVTGQLGLASLLVTNSTMGDGQWRMQAGLLGESLAVPAHPEAVRWTAARREAVAGLTWLRATFDAPSTWRSPEALAVDLSGCSKGHLFINGFDAGRFWIRDPQLSTLYQLPPDHIKPGPNTLVLWEELGVQNLTAVRVVRRVGP